MSDHVASGSFLAGYYAYMAGLQSHNSQPPAGVFSPEDWERGWEAAYNETTRDEDGAGRQMTLYGPFPDHDGKPWLPPELEGEYRLAVSNGIVDYNHDKQELSFAVPLESL